QANRLKELRDVLPHVETIVQRRADLSRSEENSKLLAERLRELQGRQNDLENEVDRAQRRKTAVQKGIADAEKKLGEVAEKLPIASAALERVKLVEQKRTELADLEAGLANFPPDLRAKVTKAKTAHQELVALERALSPLARFAESRRGLRELRERV